MSSISKFNFWRTLSWAIAIIGFYYGCSGYKYRELTFAVNPARVPIIVSGTEKIFDIYYKDSLLIPPVSSARIAFWNGGKEEIRREDIRQKLKFSIEDSSRILQAILITKSRDIVEINLDESNFNIGELSIDWDILEKNDGGAIQLIYLGEWNSSIKASSIIVGQERIIEYQYKIAEAVGDTVKDRLFSRKSFGHLLTLVILSFMMIFISAEGSLLDKLSKILFGSNYRAYKNKYLLILGAIVILSTAYDAYKFFTGIPDFV